MKAFGNGVPGGETAKRTNLKPGENKNISTYVYTAIGP